MKINTQNQFKKQMAVLAGFFALSIFLFWDVLRVIYDSWQQDEYSYAYLLLPIALLIGAQRVEGYRARIVSSWGGAFAALLSLGILAFGKISGIPSLPQYGFLLYICGLCLTFWGPDVTKRLAPTLALLFFVVPLPPSLYLPLSAEMRLVSSGLGAWILDLLGVSVFRDGNIMDLGGAKLDVAEACNGLRYLFPLTGLSFLIAYLLDDVFWKRFVVFISAIPAALFLNALRIALIGLAANAWGIDIATGLIHELGGWVGFFLCVVALGTEALLLSKIGPHGSFPRDIVYLPRGPFFLSALPLNGKVLSILVVVVVLSVLDGAGVMAKIPTVIPSRTSFLRLPYGFGNWLGQFETLDPKIIDVLEATELYNARYVNSVTQDQVGLYMAYYDEQREKIRIHSPNLCLPSSGWETVESNGYEVKTFLKPRLQVNRVVVQKTGERMLIYYWFVHGRDTALSLPGVKRMVLKGILTTGKTDVTLMRLVTPLQPNENEIKGDVRLSLFLKEAMPMLQAYIPDLPLYEVVQ